MLSSLSSTILSSNMVSSVSRSSMVQRSQGIPPLQPIFL
jgi:hypothetical protein